MEKDFQYKTNLVNKKILDIINLVIAIASPPAYISSISRIYYTGFKYTYLFQIFSLLIVWVIYIFKGKIESKYRILIITSLLVLVASAGVITFGIKGNWGNTIILYSFIISLFYGRKPGIVVLVIGVLYSFTVFIIQIKQIIPEYKDIFVSEDFNSIVFLLITVSTVATIIIYTVSKYRSFFINTIVELEKTKEKASKSEDKYKKLSNLTFEGILIHEDGLTIDVNLSLTKMFGYSREELIGKNIIKLLIEEKHHKTIARNITNSYTLPYEIEGIKKDGTIFPIEVESKDIDTNNSRVAAIRDVSVRKSNELKLKIQNKEYAALNEKYKTQNEELIAEKIKAENSTKRFENLFENNPISLWEEDFTDTLKILDKIRKLNITDYKKYLSEKNDIVKECSMNMKIINVNKATLTLLKAPSKEYLFNNIDKVLNKKSYSFFIEELGAILLNKKEFIGENELIRYDGKVITILSKMFFIEKTGKIITAAIDITERKQAERELENAKIKAEESNYFKTEFLNNISHEIRTPLNGIIGFTDFLNRPNLSIKKRKYFTNTIKKSGEQLVRIIDAIIEMSELGVQQKTLANEKVCLNELLTELYSTYNVEASKNNIPLNLKKELSDKESTILINRLILHKIIKILLENAVKYTTKGYIEFGYILKKESKPYYLEIYVKDTGIGIHKEKQKQIFKQFSQENEDIAANYGGLGLGLSIAQKNADLLNCEIKLNSEKGKGATFYIIIPYNTANINKEI